MRRGSLAAEAEGSRRSASGHEPSGWIWPLFQELKAGGATSVYQTWATAESAGDVAGLDAAVNSQLPFADTFRDFSVRNLQADDYVTGIDTGLESDSWQSFIDDFPDKSHVASSRGIGLDQYSVFGHVKVLAAQNDRFEITDPRVRQVTIDLSPLQNAGSAKLDIVGQIGQLAALTEPHRWRRIRADSSTYTFCRDFPDEDFALFYAVVSNHSSTRITKGGPDPAAAVTGFYTVEAQNHCDIPIRYEGTFKVNTTPLYGPSLIDFNAVGNVSFKYGFTSAACESSTLPPTADSLQHCYDLDSAQETWTAPSVSDDRCNYFPRAAQFSYANDQGSHGFIGITLRSPAPSYSNIYDVWLGSSTKTMEVDTTDVDPEQPCDQEDTFTIGLTFYSIVSEGCYNSVPPARFSGWTLRGSCTYQGAYNVTTWSWDLSPVFEE